MAGGTNLNPNQATVFDSESVSTFKDLEPNQGFVMIDLTEESDKSDGSLILFFIKRFEKVKHYSSFKKKRWDATLHCNCKSWEHGRTCGYRPAIPNHLSCFEQFWKHSR